MVQVYRCWYRRCWYSKHFPKTDHLSLFCQSCTLHQHNKQTSNWICQAVDIQAHRIFWTFWRTWDFKTCLQGFNHLFIGGSLAFFECKPANPSAKLPSAACHATFRRRRRAMGLVAPQLFQQRTRLFVVSGDSMFLLHALTICYRNQLKSSPIWSNPHFLYDLWRSVFGQEWSTTPQDTKSDGLHGRWYQPAAVPCYFVPFWGHIFLVCKPHKIWTRPV